MATQPWGAANKPNMNVSWMRERSAWIIYVLALAGFRYMVSMISFDSLSPAAAWSITHLTHFVITWLVLHYHKGSAFYTERQELSKKTLWEQIDDGQAYTPTKKYLTLVPVLLFLLTWHMNDMRLNFVNILNWVAVIVLVVSKLPQMQGVRLFGINAE